MSFLLSFKIYMIKLKYEVIKMKLKYLSLLLSSICIMQFMTVPSLANAQAMEIKSNLAIDLEDIKDTAEYKGYLWRIDAKDDDNLPRNFRTSKDKFKKASADGDLLNKLTSYIERFTKHSLPKKVLS